MEEIKTKNIAEKIEEIMSTQLTRKCIECRKEKILNKCNFKPYARGGFQMVCVDCKVYTGNDKPVNQYTLKGEFVKEFESIKHAANELGLQHTTLASCCRGTLKTAGKYLWKYSNEVEPGENIEAVKFSHVRMVAQYNKDGKFIKTFKSGSEAAKELNCDRQNITKACKKNFLSCGYLWRYVEEGEEIPKHIEKHIEHKRYMKQVEIFKDDKLYMSFISIKKASDYMNKNVTMCRKYLEGKEDKDGYVWKFKT